MASSGLVLRLLVVFTYVAACCAFGFSFGSKDPPTTAAPFRRAPPPPPPMATLPARADAEPHYTFRYVVQDARTGDFKSQEERRDGTKIRGTYSVAEPNGDLRVVSYSSDAEGGFRAEVRVEPGGAVLMPDDNGRTFSSFFPDPVKLFRTPALFSGPPQEVAAAPLTMMPYYNQPQYAPQAQRTDPQLHFNPQPHFTPNFIPQPQYTPQPQFNPQPHYAIQPQYTPQSQPQFTPQPQPQYIPQPQNIPQPQFPKLPQFFRSPTQQPAFDRTAAPPPTPAVFKPDPYPRQPETPAIPITPPPPVLEHHGDIITASTAKNQPQMFPGKFQMVRRPTPPVQPPPRPTPTTTRLTTPLMMTPSSVNPFAFQRQPYLRYGAVPPMVFPQRPTPPQTGVWNPYDAAAMGGTPFMLVRTYLVPVPGPINPLQPSVEPPRLVQPLRPQPTVPAKTTTEAEETTTIVDKEVPTTVTTNV